MPIFETGDMLTKIDDPNVLIVFTANSTIRSNGSLVMGRGIARDIRDRFPGIDAKFGQLIQMQRLKDSWGLLILDYHGRRIGAFQVKTRFNEAASPALIKAASAKLSAWANSNSSIVIHLNYPGIGYGMLPEDVVRPLIADLPSNVHVWKRNNPTPADR